MRRRATLPFIASDRVIYALDGLSPYVLNVVYGFAGPIDVEALAVAVDAVLARIPILRSVAELGRLRSRWRVLPAAAPEQRLRVIDLEPRPVAGSDPDDSVTAALRQIVAEPLDLTAVPAARFALLRGGSSDALLVLSCHHVPVDAPAILLVIDELRRSYEALLAGGPPSRDPLPLHRSRAALLGSVPLRRWASAAWRSARHHRRLGRAGPTVHLRFSGTAGAIPGFRTLHFDEEQTAALEARRCGLEASRSEYLVASLVMAARRWNGPAADPAGRYRIVVPVNLRRYLPEGRAVFASFMGGALIQVPAAPALSFETTVATVKEQLREIRDGHHALAPNLLFPLVRLLPARALRRLLLLAYRRRPAAVVPTASVAYVGTAPGWLQHLGPARLVSRITISTGFFPPGVNLHAALVSGTLTVTLSYLRAACPDREMDAFVGMLREQLLGAGESDAAREVASPEVERDVAPPPVAGRTEAPWLSLIIPAYNEERFLGPTLDNVAGGLQRLRRHTGAGAEVIVVDNNSSDGTAALARARGARVVFEPVNQIAAARNAGARAARGRVLAFLDADDHMSPNLLVRVHELMESGRYAAGGVRNIRRDFAHPLERVLEGINNAGRRLSGLSHGLMYCRREYFERIGGFDERYFAAEEARYMLRLRLAGRRDGKRFANIQDEWVYKSSRQFYRRSSLELVTMMLGFVLFPWRLRRRAACSLWYDVGDRDGEPPAPRSARTPEP